MHPAVHFLLLEAGVLPEGVLPAVLQDEVAAGMEEILREHPVGKGFQAFQGVGRIGEDDVELLPADGEEVEHVVTDHRHVRKPQALRFGLDEGGVLAHHFHAVHAGCAAGGELERNGAGPSEEVQHLEVLEFVFVVQDVEQAFAGEVRGRARLVARGRLDGLPLQASTDDPHSSTTALK